MKRGHQGSYGGGATGYGGGGGRAESSSMVGCGGKGTRWKDVQDAGGVDELLAVLGYNPSDLSGWVQRMLSELNSPPLPHSRLGLSSSSSSAGVLQDRPIQQDSLPSGSSSSISFSNSQSQQSGVSTDDSEYDPTAIPRVAAYPPLESKRGNSWKWTKIPVRDKEKLRV